MLSNDNSPVSSVLACCGLFAAAGFIYSRLRRNKVFSKYATYAEVNDLVVNLDSEFDPLLFELYQKADYSRCIFAEYNPPFESESKIFNSHYYFDPRFIGTMLQRNALLLSKLFIKNISPLINKNFISTVDMPKVLDIGCGIALTLPGLRALCGDKIDYLGVDIDPTLISENQQIYRNYTNTHFVAQNAVNTLTARENRHKFDVILVQHPNFSSWHSKEAFKKIFEHITEALATGGIIYITFYYEHEVDYFNEHVLPNLSEKIPFYAITKNNNYYKPLVYNDKGKPVEYTPEQFSLQSLPKPALTAMPAVTRFA